jgi:hypothetical protein
MAEELYIRFKNPSWVTEQQEALIQHIEALSTYVRNNEDEYWLLGLEDRGSEDRWQFDVRIFVGKSPALVEISAHPHSIEQDLKLLFSWLRSRTPLSIIDEDGAPSGW